MAKKKTKQVDAQTKAVEVIVANTAISPATKAALLKRLSNDLEDLEGDLLDLQPNYDRYMEYKQTEHLTKLMLSDIERLPVTDEPTERKQDDIAINDTEADRDNGEAAKRG